jgi:hypothetical protein
MNAVLHATDDPEAVGSQDSADLTPAALQGIEALERGLRPLAESLHEVRILVEEFLEERVYQPTTLEWGSIDGRTRVGTLCGCEAGWNEGGAHAAFYACVAHDQAARAELYDWLVAEYRDRFAKCVLTPEDHGFLERVR